MRTLQRIELDENSFNNAPRYLYSRTVVTNCTRDLTRVDERGLDWHPGQNLEAKEPWNTVGIPYKPVSKNGTIRNRGNNFVRNAANDIEQRQVKIEFQSLRKNPVEINTDASEARLFWKERDQMLQNRNQQKQIRKPDVVEEREKPEDVIILKLEKIKGILLAPNDSVTLVSLSESNASDKEQREREVAENINVDDTRFKEEEEEGTNWNYEENWKKKDLGLWNSEQLFYPLKDTVFSQIQNTHIPRAQGSKYCKMCRSFYINDKCCKCGNRKSSSSKGYAVSDSNPGYKTLDMNVQKSRTNFFGNSGSYTLRCDLNPIKKARTDWKRFYLIPEPLRTGYFKHLNESDPHFEDFVAKKRKFLREKISSSKSLNEGDTRCDTIMW